MNPDRFDAITRLFGERRLSRRKVLTETGAGLAAAGIAATGIAGVDGDTIAAQEATPAVEQAEHATHPTMLFVQSFQSGHIAPKAGEEGRYTVTLEHGLGETVYFSDRPERIVGANPTQQFLDGLGFSPNNPPNAAILTSTGESESTIAVVTLFAPDYDEASAKLTYEVEMLEHWQKASDLEFGITPVDIDALGVDFGTTHVFIDGCADLNIECFSLDEGRPVVGVILNSEFGGTCVSSNGMCVPCNPQLDTFNDTRAYWAGRCTERYGARCGPKGCDFTYY